MYPSTSRDEVGHSTYLCELLAHLPSSSQAKQLQTIHESDKRVEANILEAIRQSNNELKSKLSLFAREFAASPRGDRLGKLTTDYETYISNNQDAIGAVSMEISSRVNQERTKRATDYILSTLYFVQIRERQMQIHEAHGKTFSWIFEGSLPEDRPHSDFVEWLESTSQIHRVFWVSGKPGSGKSTLMRYLSESPRTKDSLCKWSDSKPLLFATCFFWMAGNDIQKSLDGMLRSLLHDLLMQAPSLVPLVAPWRWRTARFEEALPSWAHSELIESFDRLLKETCSSYRICLFIDGLDEFEGGYKQQSELVAFLVGASQSESTKICVSSRPYPIFLDSFRDFPHLRLELCTRKDIQIYVEDELGRNREFESIHRRHPHRCSRLMTEIVDKAQGVFLWVYLVLWSLKQGLTEGDSISGLLRRLREIPPDLDEYFQRILSSVSPSQRLYASMYFRIRLADKEGRPPLLCFFHIEEEDPNFLDTTPMEALDPESIQERQKILIRRIYGRCRGLLEKVRDVNFSAGSQFEFRVDFLHRTVRDFLLSKETQNVLNEYSPDSFDGLEYLCRATLAQLKTLDRDRDSVEVVAREFLRYARDLELESGKAHPELVEKFTQALNCHSPSYPTSLGSTVALALVYRLEHYAVESLRSGNLNVDAKYGHPLIPRSRLKLFDSLLRCSIYNGCGEITDLLNAPQWIPLAHAVEVLLARGAGPNKVIMPGSAETVWEQFLSKANDRRRSDQDPSNTELTRWREKEAAFVQTAKSFILHGATNSPTHAIRLKTAFPGNDGEELAALLTSQPTTVKQSNAAARVDPAPRYDRASRFGGPARLDQAPRVGRLQRFKQAMKGRV